MDEDTDPQARALPGAARAGDPVLVAECTFRVANLPEVRELAAARARAYGASETFVSDFLIAVNEVATNAVTHGSDKAHMRMWAQDGHIFVAVHDDGRWHPDDAPGRTPPPPHATHGMGLWVARLLASQISFTTGPSGTTVTMGFKV